MWYFKSSVWAFNVVWMHHLVAVQYYTRSLHPGGVTVRWFIKLNQTRNANIIVTMTSLFNHSLRISCCIVLASLFFPLSFSLFLVPPGFSFSPPPPPGRPSPVVVLWRAAGLEVVGDVPVGEELQDPLGQWQRLDLVGRDGVAQDGAAQVGQAGHLDGGPPEPDVTIPGSATRRQELLVM